jgi:hypothetical protein
VVSSSRSSSRHQEVAAAAINRGAAVFGRGVDVYGPREIDALLSSLVGSVHAPAVLRAWTGSAGANRNVLTLLTAGESVLFLDDDIQAVSWEHPEVAAGLKVTGHVDDREWDFFESRERALSSLARSGRSILETSSGVLGRTLTDLVKEIGDAADWHEACPDILNRLASGRDFLVRIAFAGLAGDSGIGCRYRLLWATGPLQRLLRTDVAKYRLAFSSREVTRVVRQATLTHDPSCMAGCIGLLNTSLLPPFGHLGRNEDGVFGALVNLILPDSVAVHLPVGVVHDSLRDPGYEDTPIQSATTNRWSDVLISIMHTIDPLGLPRQPELRLKRVGATLLEMAAMPPIEFQDLLVGAVLRSRTSEIRTLKERTALLGPWTEWWGPDIERWIDAFVTSAAASRYYYPVEYSRSHLRRLRSDLEAFGTLLTVWPDLWESARSCNSFR